MPPAKKGRSRQGFFSPPPSVGAATYPGNAAARQREVVDTVQRIMGEDVAPPLLMVGPSPTASCTPWSGWIALEIARTVGARARGTFQTGRAGRDGPAVGSPLRRSPIPVWPPVRVRNGRRDRQS